jgi:hypothetical protein
MSKYAQRYIYSINELDTINKALEDISSVKLEYLGVNISIYTDTKDYTNEVIEILLKLKEASEKRCKEYKPYWENWIKSKENINE